MKKSKIIQTVSILLISVVFNSLGSASANQKVIKQSVETFPIMAAFGVYSLQYVYDWTENDSLILGLAYVNSTVSNQKNEVIGQFFAPTIPIGYRRYLLGNFHVEYQLWPAYNCYFDKTEDKFYNGFDLYSELRAGYRLDLKFGNTPFFLNLQYVYGIGLIPGNKPESFIKVAEESPPFHVPSISVGIKF